MMAASALLSCESLCQPLPTPLLSLSQLVQGRTVIFPRWFSITLGNYYCLTSIRFIFHYILELRRNFKMNKLDLSLHSENKGLDALPR